MNLCPKTWREGCWILQCDLIHGNVEGEFVSWIKRWRGRNELPLRRVLVNRRLVDGPMKRAKLKKSCGHVEDVSTPWVNSIMKFHQTS